MTEIEIVKYFNKSNCRWLCQAAEIVSRVPFLVVFWITIAIVVLIVDVGSGQSAFIAMAIAAIMHFTVSEGIMKYLFPVVFFKRQRPYLAYPKDIVPYGQNHNDSSFPSNHMSTTLAMLTVLVFFYPLIWPLGLTFSLFMAYARMRNGMHYPSDVLAGAALGILYGLIAIILIS